MKDTSPIIELINKNQKLKITILPILFFSLVFIANPLIAIILLFLYLMISGNNNSILLYFTCVILAIFLGLINSTKIPESDLIWYINGYLDAGRTPFKEYLFTFGINGSGKELAFPLMNFLIYQIIGNNINLYLITYSLIAYSLLNISIYKFGKAMEFSNEIVVSSIFIMSFTPYIFTMSEILMRQFLADALLMYIMVNMFFYNKKHILLIIIMVLIHSSSFLFVPFLFFPFFKKPFSKKTMFYYILGVLILLGMQKIATAILPFINNVPILNYIFSRASSGTTYDLGELSTIKIMTSILTMLIPIIIINLLQPNLKKSTGLIHFFNILTFLVLFILANLHQSELSIRLNFYVWQFFPFVFLLIANYLKFNKILLYPIGIALIAFFIYYLDAGMWTYKVGSGIFYNSIFHYLI